MILHLCTDQKFIDMAYDAFEKAAPGKNEFMVISKTSSFRYIKSTPVTTVTLFEFLSNKFAESLSGYEFIVIHYMHKIFEQAVVKAADDVKFVWIGWGGDQYDKIDYKLFLDETEALFRSSGQDAPEAASGGFSQKIKKWVVDTFFCKKVSYEQLFSKIDYYAPVIEDEYPLMKKYFPDFQPQFADWNYGTLEDDWVRDMDLKVVGNNIMIGNSATYENNHLEAFSALKNIDIFDKKIIVPLGYGDDEYKKHIIKRGMEDFGENFQPLQGFLAIDEYNRTISSCSVVIMNHLRQQAVGNIITMLYMGAKVFLNSQNPVFTFMKRKGFIIYEMDQLKEHVGSAMNHEDVLTNRALLNKIWGRDAILSKTANLISLAVGQRGV